MSNQKEQAKYEIDSLDKEILNRLLQDARTPYLEIARQLRVSGGTIHQRVDKMREAGIIQGSTLLVDHERLGLGVTVLLGVHLHNARMVRSVIEELEALDEVVEAYYTSGNYALFVKLYVESIKDYHNFLVERLQAIEGIRFTESFICLDQPISRPLSL